TRRLRKDGSVYYGPYFPANLAYRIVDLIHRSFLVPSCTVDLNRPHPRPCLQYYIGRCLGPCVEGLTTPEIYQEAVRDVKLFLDDLPEFEPGTIETPGKGPASSRADSPSIDSNGTSETRALPDTAVPKKASAFQPDEFFSSLLTQLYIGQPYVPRNIYVPVDFEDRDMLEEVLSEQMSEKNARPARINISVPQRGDKRSLIDLAASNAKQLYDQRFRIKIGRAHV